MEESSLDDLKDNKNLSKFLSWISIKSILTIESLVDDSWLKNVDIMPLNSMDLSDILTVPM